MGGPRPPTEKETSLEGGVLDLEKFLTEKTFGWFAITYYGRPA